MIEVKKFGCLGACAMLAAASASIPASPARAETPLLLAQIVAEQAAATHLAQMAVPRRSVIEQDGVPARRVSILRLGNLTVAQADPNSDGVAEAELGAEADSGAAASDASDESDAQSSGAGAESNGDEVAHDNAAGAQSGGVNPDFKEWQRLADEKLKGEVSPKSFEHPLAKANGKDFIVVCEAGCRNAPDDIVSRVPKPEHMTAAPRTFDPTSSNPATAAAKPHAQQHDPAMISCLAGCPRGVKAHKARMPRRAALDAPGAAPSTASAGRLMLAPQIASNGAIIGPHFAPNQTAERPHNEAPQALQPVHRGALTGAPSVRRSRRIANASNVRNVRLAGRFKMAAVSNKSDPLGFGYLEGY